MNKLAKGEGTLGQEVRAPGLISFSIGISSLDASVDVKMLVKLIILGLVGTVVSVPKQGTITTWVTYQCYKATVSSCHRCLINTSVEKMNNI